MDQLGIFDKPAHHNTTNLEPAELEKAEKAAINQEDIILNLFRDDPAEKTPCHVWEILGYVWPLTSVRRAMSNLTDNGLLYKTTTQRIGIYGKPAYCWKLR